MSKFSQAFDKIIAKGKDVATNIYLADNPKKFMFQDEKHLSVINQKLPPNIWIEKNRTMGETTTFGYFVVEKVKYSKETYSKAFQAFADLKEDRFFTSDSYKLEAYLKENYSKELGWDKPDVTGLTPERVKQIMAGPQKTQALQRTL